MSTDDVASSVAEIEGLMRDRLRIRAETLSRQIDKAGRLLPRRIARDARYLAQARTLVQNPKLARMIDPSQVGAARDRVVAHLLTVDPARRRTDRLLGILAILAFNLLLIGGALVAWMVWRGIV